VAAPVGRHRGDARALAVVALVLVLTLVIGRFLDGHRDRAQQRLVDVLHLTDQLHEQDAARWRATRSAVSSRAPIPGPLAFERGIGERVRYLAHLGAAKAEARRLALEVGALESDLHRLVAAAGPAPDALQAQIDRDLASAVGDLSVQATDLKASVGRGDKVIDTGTVAALLVPALAYVALHAGRRLRRAKRRRSGDPDTIGGDLDNVDG
jgi:hypothetical protein